MLLVVHLLSIFQKKRDSDKTVGKTIAKGSGKRLTETNQWINYFEGIRKKFGRFGCSFFSLFS
jgi:hypothetical protein